MLDPTDVHPLTDFQRNAKLHLSRLHRDKRATALTVNGRTAAILLDPTEYKRISSLAQEAEDMAALRIAFAELQSGKGKTFAEVAADIRKRRQAHRAAPRRRK